MATLTVGRPLLPLRIPPEVQRGGEAHPHDPHRFTGPELTHLAPRSGWGSDPHGPIYYKGRYHLFYQACHASCQWWWGLHWEHCVSEDLINWVRLPPAIMPTPGWLDADGCFTGNIRVDPKTGTPTLFYTGARLRHNPAAAERHPDPPLSACNPLMLHWETQLCAVADPDDELLVHWTKVAAPWMELPHCAYLTAWRDPFFVPPVLDPKTGQPLPGQENRLQVRPAIAHTLPVASATPDEDGPKQQQQQQQLPPHAAGANGPQVLKDDDGYMMIIGSGHEGVGGTALVYRSKDLHRGWHFDGYLCTWPNLQTGLCWECPHLLNLPDLPEGLHCLTSRTDPSFLPTKASPTELEAKRARQQELVRMAAEAMDQAALEVARKGIAAQILAEAERAQAEHEAMAAFARAQAQLGESAALTPAAQRAADDASELARMEHDAAQHDAALVAAAAAISTDAELTDRLSPTMSCAIGNAREQKQHALSAAAVAAPQAWAARAAVCEQKMQEQAVAVGQPPPLSGAVQEEIQAAATAAAAAGALSAAPAAAAERLHPGEPSALALAASGMLTALPGDQPALGPAQTYLLSSLFSESGEVPPLGVDSAKLMAQLLEQQQVGEGGLAAAGGAGLTAPREAGLTAAEGAGAPSAPPAAANERNPLYTAMQREVSEFQKKQEQCHADPWARHVPIVLKKIISRRSGEKQAGERQVGDKRRQDALVSHPVSPFLSPPASPTTPSPPESPFKTAATPSTQPSTQGVPSTQPSTQEVPPIPAPLPHAPSLAAYSEPNSPKPTAAPPKPLSPTPPLQLQPDTDLACPSPTRVCAAGIPRPGAPEPPPTPPFPLPAPTASLPALSPSMEGLLEDRSDGLQGLEAAPTSASALHEAVHGTASLPPLPTALERSPSLTAAAFAALVPQREQFTQKVASVASATQLAADELARQQSLPREAADAGPVAQASAPVMAVLEHARTAIKDATASTDDYKAAAEASMMGLGLPGVLSTSQLEGSQSPLDLASSIQSKIAADVQQQKQQQQQQQQLETLPEQAELEMRAQQQELQPQEQDKVEGGMRAPCCGSLASQASQAATAEPESARSLEKAVDEGRKEAIKDVAEMAQDGPAAEQHRNQSVAATAPRGAARQGGESTPATHRQYPEPPLFKEGAKPSVAEIRAACRAYAEAAAAAQGFDLGMPSPDSRVVRQVAEGPPPIPEPARPSQRWLLGLAPDAATYGIIYFLGDYCNGSFDLEGSTGPYKLDLGNVLYAPVAFYDQKVGRLLVWGYLKELWQLSPPPAMCNKFAMSGGVSMPRALYLKGGKLFQVPIPEVSELRQEGRCFSVYGMRLLPGAPLLVPGMQAANGMQAGIEGDHVDVELVIRRGSASRTTLLLDSWRPKGRGAAALVFDWETKQLKIIYKAHMRPDLWSSAAEADPEASHAADKEGTRWAQDLAGLLATSTAPSAEGGKSTITDEDGAVYDVFTDAKCPPVPDMNPAVPDWIRMDRGRAGGTLDMREGDPLELRVFIDGSAVEIFTGTGQVLSTRVYRGAPSRTAHSESLKELGVSQGECPGEHGGTSARAHNVAEGSQAAPPGEDSSMAASHGQDGSRAAHQASSIQSDQGGAKLQLLSVGGSCVIERAEFHQMRSVWLRGQADAPLPPPVSQEALELWRADARKAANYAEEAALAVGNKMKQ